VTSLTHRFHFRILSCTLLFQSFQVNRLVTGTPQQVHLLSDLLSCTLLFSAETNTDCDDFVGLALTGKFHAFRYYFVLSAFESLRLGIRLLRELALTGNSALSGAILYSLVQSSKTNKTCDFKWLALTVESILSGTILCSLVRSFKTNKTLTLRDLLLTENSALSGYLVLSCSVFWIHRAELRDWLWQVTLSGTIFSLVQSVRLMGCDFTWLAAHGKFRLSDLLSCSLVQSLRTNKTTTYVTGTHQPVALSGAILYMFSILRLIRLATLHDSTGRSLWIPLPDFYLVLFVSSLAFKTNET
jgi:hypothetical protein